MKPADVKAIEELRDKTGNLVNKLNAERSDEWDAKEKLTAAHKQLRSIDCASLLQGSLME